MKNKWENYAFKNGKVKSCYQREYCNRKKCRKTGEASGGDSLLQGGEVQPEVKEEIDDMKFYGKFVQLNEEVPLTKLFRGAEAVVLDILGRASQTLYKEQIGTHESIREEVPIEAHQEGRQGVPIPDKRRRKVKERDPQKQAGEEEVNNACVEDTEKKPRKRRKSKKSKLSTEDVDITGDSAKYTNPIDLS